MHVLVLGGCGIQGRAALHDLSRNPAVDRVTCADARPDLVDSFGFLKTATIQAVPLDAADPDALASVMNGPFDVAIDFLPPQWVRPVAEAAIENGVHLVNTNYAHDLLDLDRPARQKGVSILPECGLDPGIDLVLYGYGLRFFEKVIRLNSYCGGIPEKAACDNPLNYKISWNMLAVLKSQMRDAALMADGKRVDIPGKDQHDNPYIHQIDFPGLGALEAIPNGDAVKYARLLNIEKDLSETGRYTLRWPGWSAFWHPLKKLGFLNDTPIDGRPGSVPPIEYVAKLLEPQLQYKESEKDLCVMVNTFEGIREKKSQMLTLTLLIERDLATGLMAMSRGVAYPACIAAEMITTGEIGKRGILSPATDIPCDLFMLRLNSRGIKINETIQDIDERAVGIQKT